MLRSIREAPTSSFIDLIKCDDFMFQLQLIFILFYRFNNFDNQHFFEQNQTLIAKKKKKQKRACQSSASDDLFNYDGGGDDETKKFRFYFRFMLDKIFR